LKKLKVTFAEGCFDELAEEMTQEELDALTAEIQELVDSGELFENSEPLSSEESDLILKQLSTIEKNTRQ
jgi:predicted ribosome quality control (RQC) complex YloA/Tae2 family protein